MQKEKPESMVRAKMATDAPAPDRPPLAQIRVRVFAAEVFTFDACRARAPKNNLQDHTNQTTYIYIHIYIYTHVFIKYVLGSALVLVDL